MLQCGTASHCDPSQPSKRWLEKANTMCFADRFFRNALNVSDVVRWGDCAKAPLQVLFLGIPLHDCPLAQACNLREPEQSTASPISDYCTTGRCTTCTAHSSISRCVLPKHSPWDKDSSLQPYNHRRVRWLSVIHKLCAWHVDRCATWHGMQGAATIPTPGWTSSSRSWCGSHSVSVSALS
jgi:hypothetical protein